jgi:hypothetical protein
VKRVRGDTAQVGGFEAVAFGVLVFVLGALLVTNAWAVVDAKVAATAAAREAARVFVEAPDSGDAEGLAMAAAGAELVARGRDAARATVRIAAGSFARCELVTFEVSYVVPTVSLPFIGGWGDGIRVSARHGEIVDPYRNGPEGEASCV